MLIFCNMLQLYFLQIGMKYRFVMESISSVIYVQYACVLNNICKHTCQDTSV